MQRVYNRREFLKVFGGGIAGAALLGAAGCGGGGAPGDGDEVTLTWWDYWTEGATQTGIQNQIQRYMEAHPNVTVERRTIPFAELKPTLLRSASAGELPDISIIDNPDHQAFASVGVFRDHTDLIEEWGEFDLYFDGPRESATFEGRPYGIPNSSNCLSLFYNEDLLEEAGVDPPTDWDELLAAAESLTRDNRFGLAVSAVRSEEGTFQWLPFLWQAGEDLDTLDSDGGRAALQLWVDMVENGYMSQGILNWRQEDVKNEFAQGRAAMMINGPWQVPVLKEENPDLNWGVAKLPEGEESASILGGENMGVTSGSENVEAAWDLLTWMQAPENLKEYLLEVDRLPSREDLAEEPEWSEDPILSVFAEQLAVARPRAYGENYPEISEAVQEAMQAAISGQADVATALSRAQERITPLLPEG